MIQALLLAIGQLDDPAFRAPLFKGALGSALALLGLAAGCSAGLGWLAEGCGSPPALLEGSSMSMAMLGRGQARWGGGGAATGAEGWDLGAQLARRGTHAAPQAGTWHSKKLWSIQKSSAETPAGATRSQHHGNGKGGRRTR